MTLRTMHSGLHLVAAPEPPPPLPELPQLFDESPRRPGEFHEPVALDPYLRELLECAARRARLATGVTGRLLIEAALVRGDFAGLEAEVGLGRLDAVARRTEVRRRLSAAEADYLRDLRRPAGFSQTLFTISVRLIGRLDDVDLESALGGDPAQAVTWEIAALLDGRTMAEWALAAALRTGLVSPHDAAAGRGDRARRTTP